MKRIALFAAMLLCGGVAAAQDQDGVIYDRLDSVVVSVSRAGKRTPVTYSSFGRKELQSSNPMNSLPMSLSLLPSVVTYNEGGTGLGNSAMTIRGSKGSQINVTLNGITLNDSESQEVFWVNIPSLSALLSNVQVQRGLGTSANGAGAFGASINMNTAFVGVEPSARLEFSGGSYNTFITTLSSSSGISDKGFYGSAAYSRGTTDGYIRNAFVRSQSAFVALGWLSGKNSLRLTYLMGDQHSGITWDGISLEQYAADRRYNGAGEYYDEFGNVCYYPNQSDNYSQHHLQLNYSRQFSDALSWTNTINYTRGDGYDEYYKTGRKLERFGFASPVTGTDGNPYTKSDLIYRKKMDNDYWVLGSSLKYRSGALSASAGVNLSDYRGAHWGENLFAKVLGDAFDYSSLDWYRNDGHKREASLFARAEYLITPSLNVYADLQGRLIGYSFTGKDDDWLEMGSNPADIIDYGNTWTFFNPRTAGPTALTQASPWATVNPAGPTSRRTSKAA